VENKFHAYEVPLSEFCKPATGAGDRSQASFCIKIPAFTIKGLSTEQHAL
jgi:hypothetical protein